MIKRLSILLAVFTLYVVDGGTGGPRKQAEAPSVSIGQPFRIYPSNVTQTETFITRHPSNPNILFASANTINLATGFISEGVYVSTTGGTTWTGNDTCTGAPILFHGGEPGIAIDRNGTFILIRFGFSPGLYSHFSTNNGLTWSSQRTISTGDQDRATLVSDGIPTSLYYGRSYASWVRFAIPYPIYFSYTNDGGVSWTAPAQINSPTQRCQGAEVSIGPNGRVNICWAAVINTSPFTEDYVGFATSTNGGTTWTVIENAFDVNGIQGTFPQKSNIRVNGLPKIDTDNTGGPRNGWIYIVTTERNLPPAGSDPDVIIHRSTNNGQSWSAGIRVNGDPLNNGKAQYFPAIHVDHTGGVNVLYYDDRNTTSDSASVFFSRSTDGGTTWNDYRIGSRNFRPQPIGGLGQGYQGDNIGMTSVGNTLWPVWMDNSSGIYQAWTCPIDITTLDVESNNPNGPTTFTLYQNSPNPFNPSTTILFDVPAGTRHPVSLYVYDVLGREVARLANGEMRSGRNEVLFDAAGLSTGIYFYRLQAGTFSQTRKMLLIQ